MQREFTCFWEARGPFSTTR